jgi:hypothetical protein
MLRKSAVILVLASGLLSACYDLEAGRSASPGFIAAGPAGDVLIYDGPTQSTYRVCYDGPGAVTVKSDTDKTATLTGDGDPTSGHHSCVDMRASDIQVHADNARGAIRYNLVDGARQ